MNSQSGEKFLGEHLTNINDLLSSGHDPKVSDLIKYEDAVELSNISYSEGYREGEDFQRNREDYDTWIVEQFRNPKIDGLPKVDQNGNSRLCLCVVKMYSPYQYKLVNYVFARYNINRKKWILELCCNCDTDRINEEEVLRYLEIPLPGRVVKEYDVTLQTRSTNRFTEVPDGIYEGKFGGHVGMITYLDKVYNFTFLKGIPQINIPKTITVIDGWAWTMLMDGPITPNIR